MAKENNYQKLIFIILSLILVGISLLGKIITSNNGSLSLLSFESFYVYLGGVVLSIYLIIKNKNLNIFIIATLLSYFWTYYLVDEILKFASHLEPKTTIYFYLYLSSAIFLIISLFVGNTQKETEQTQNNDTILSSNAEVLGLNKDDFIFTSFIMGLKEIPYNTPVLLTNNTSNKCIDLAYVINNVKGKLSLPLNTIKSLTYTSKVRTSTTPKKVETNETKSLLLSTVLFGGNPLIQTLGTAGFNSFFDSVSNNYEKVNLNTEYEIIINFNNNTNFIFLSSTKPENFINQVLKEMNINQLNN